MRSRPPVQHLEPPQVLLLSLALVVADVVVLVVTNVFVRGIGCTTVGCQIAHSGSVGRAFVAVALAVATIVGPVGVAVFRRRGIRTVAVVQVVAGALLLVHAAGMVSTAHAFDRDPTPLPSVVQYVPCAEKTLAGHTCVSQAPNSDRPSS